MIYYLELIGTGGQKSETYSDIKHTDFTEYCEKRRMWRMSDILSVSMQDILHSWKPDL